LEKTTAMKQYVLVLLTIVLNLNCVAQRTGKNASFYKEGFIDVGQGVSLFYQQVGKGKQKIIAPLGFWIYDDFRHLADSGDRTFIFFDMRNRGRSSSVADSNLLDIRAEIEDIEKIRRHFRFEKVSLIGCSYLGFLVMLYTQKYPQYVDKVIQIGPVPARWDEPYPDSLRYTVALPSDKYVQVLLDSLKQSGYASKHPQEFTRLVYETRNKPGLLGDPTKITSLGHQWVKHIDYPNEWIENFSRHLKYHFRSIQQLNARFDDFKDVRQPVLVIHGTRDRNAAFGGGKQWAATLPNAQLLRVEGAAHVPWIEQPALVFTAINRFLSK